MGSSGTVSEIVESKEALDLVQQFTGSNTLSIKVKAEGKVSSHGYLADDNHNRLLKAIDSRTSSMIVGSPRQMFSELQQKNASKMPINAGVSPTSGIGISESVTLKQALRKLCISQASEMAATKRLSKSNGLSDASEAGTLKRLLASVVAPTSESEDKGNLVDISLVPEKTTKDFSTEMSKVHSSEQTCVPAPYQAVPPTGKVQKTRIQDVIACDPSDPVELGDQGKGEFENVKLSKPRTSPFLFKSFLRSKTKFKKKGDQQPDLILDSFEKCNSMDKIGISPSTPKSAYQIETISPASSSTDVPNKKGTIKNTDGEMSKPKPDYGSSVTIDSKIDGNTRTREKGESSQSSKSSMDDYSSSTSLSDESHNSFGNCSRPHMSKDVRWEAIRDVEMQHGSLGLSNFRLLKRLGCGDIGTVYLAELTGSDCMFALKVMDVEFLVSRKKLLRAQTERGILQILDHPFLPTLYTSFTTDNLSCLVIEYCPGGDLHVLRQRQPGRTFSEPAAKFYVAEVLLALEYLHMLGVVYRDLKPENILVREDGHIMLSDFDLSLRCIVRPTLVRSSSVDSHEPVKRLSGPCSENSCIEPFCLPPSRPHGSCFTARSLSSSERRKIWNSQLPQLVVVPTDARSNSFVGTHEYLAPEIIRGDGHGSAVDWWTLGIFLYELLYGRTPFKGPGNDETLANVISQSLRFPQNPVISRHAKELIRALLVKEPEKRLGSNRGAAEIKKHPFFEGMNWALIRCASPPEIPRTYDVVPPLKKKECKCLDFRSNGDDVEFELF